MHSLRTLLFTLCFFPLILWGKEPEALYLTWLHDPTTTMTVQWHTPKQESSTTLSYQEEGKKEWQTAQGSSQQLGHSLLLVHTLELTDLKPDTDYLFRLAKKNYRFRTLPSTLSRPVTFAAAGDAYYYLSLFKKMNRQIARTNPDFIIVGGDIAYAIGKNPLLGGKRWELKRWQIFFKEWKKQMITQEGRVIPLLPILGNHDIAKGIDKSGDPFYQLFAFPEKETAYRALDFGNYLSLVLLDSGHGKPVCGQQAEWLEKTLQEKQSFPYKMVSYHVAAYPSYYTYDSPSAQTIRTCWVPLFEKYHEQVAFEYHNHTYKRTHPIKEGKIDPEGVIYLGDGSWGTPPRTPRSPPSWYLASTRPVNAFWLATLTPAHCLLQSWDNKGKKIEELRIFPLSHF